MACQKFLGVLAILLTLVLVDAVSADPPKAPGGIYVAVGYGGRRIRSLDGFHWDNDTQWSDKAADNDDVLFNIAYGKGRFVAVGGSGVGHVLTTVDGKSWRETAKPRGRVATVAFGDGRFVAGHDGEFLVSPDGESWETGGKLDFRGGIHFRKSAFGNGVFVIVGDCDPEWKSPRVSCRCSTHDGKSAASFDVDTPTARAIAFGAERFVVVGPDGLRESSADGKRWEHQQKEAGEDFDGVVWTGRQFLVTGGKHAYTSPDGVQWKKEDFRVPCTVLYAKGDVFIGASWGGNLWHSSDGREWKKVEITPGMPSFEAVAYGTPGDAAGH
ncbi:MAG TPA: hypothetical protein VG269_03545 [Tepidisphaeraceae bacterium]|jgi:hypothetical protein|nr:hypothetical protein [Tepidisphaeraceae bacterium]